LILCQIEGIIDGGQKMSVVVLDENRWHFTDRRQSQYMASLWERSRM